MIPLNASNQQTDQTSQTAAGRQESATGAYGGSRGNLINIAFPGANLSSDPGGTGAPVPWYTYAIVGVAGLLAFWFILNRK